MRATGAVSEFEVNLNVRTGVVEPELPSCIRWLGIEPLNRILKALLEVVKVLLEAIELVIRA